jgi:hypothetical protein
VRVPGEVSRGEPSGKTTGRGSLWTSKSVWDMPASFSAPSTGEACLRKKTITLSMYFATVVSSGGRSPPSASIVSRDVYPRADRPPTGEGASTGVFIPDDA